MTETHFCWAFIVTLILLFLIWLIRSIIDVNKHRKAYKECKHYESKIEDINKNFKTLMNSVELLRYGDWYYYKQNIFKTTYEHTITVDDLFDSVFENLKKLIDKYNELHMFYQNTKAEIDKIKASISYNISHWYKKEDKLPVFFVLESVGDIYIPLYCHSTNLRWNKNGNIEGVVYFSKIKDGVIQEITPRDYWVRPMNKDEFENEYLLKRLETMEFSDVRNSVSYENYLKNEFNKQNIYE